MALFDADASTMRKGERREANGSLGSSRSCAKVNENTKRGARGLLLPASTEQVNADEETLLPGSVTELAGRDHDGREVLGMLVPAEGAKFCDAGPSTQDRVHRCVARHQASEAHRPPVTALLALARRAGSATSNGETHWSDPALKATRAG